MHRKKHDNQQNMKKNLRSRELCDKNFLGRVQLTSMVGKPKSITLIR